jgi:hypothetical protein
MHRLYRDYPYRGSVPYSRIMEIDAAMQEAMEQAPAWMKFNPVDGMPNPFPEGIMPSPWIHWQRMNYLVSADNTTTCLYH